MVGMEGSGEETHEVENVVLRTSCIREAERLSSQMQKKLSVGSMEGG